VLGPRGGSARKALKVFKATALTLVCSTKDGFEVNAEAEMSTETKITAELLQLERLGAELAAVRDRIASLLKEHSPKMSDGPRENERPRAFRPEDIAARWQCSPRTVRNMIARGDLPSFLLGGKLQRVRAEDVEAFERRGQTSIEDGIGPDGKAKTGPTSPATPFVPKIVRVPTRR